MDMEYDFVSIQNVSVDDRAFDVTLKIINTSTLQGVIKDLDLDVYIDGEKIGKVTENNPILIPAKGSSFVTFRLTLIDPGMLYLSSGGGIIDKIGNIIKKKDASLTLKGKAKVKSAFLTFNVPVDYTDSIKSLLS